MGNSCLSCSTSPTIFHPQLGLLQLHQSFLSNINNNNNINQPISSSLYLLKSNFYIFSLKQYQSWSMQIKKHQFNIQTKNILYLPIKNVLIQKKTNIIIKSNEKHQEYTNTLQTYYQSYIQTIFGLINRYKFYNYLPSEELLWYLLYVFVKIGKYFEKINRKIGNICMNNVLVVCNQKNKSKNVKIIYEKTMYNDELIDKIDKIKMKMEYADQYLLAPEEIQMLHENQDKSNIKINNPQISQVYSIAILLLGIANLQPPHTIYVYHPQHNHHAYIDQQKLNIFMQTFLKRNYSQLLTQTIKQMLQPTPQNRVSFIQLYKRMSEYQQQILSKNGLIYSQHQLKNLLQTNFQQNPNFSNLSFSLEQSIHHRSIFNNKNNQSNFTNNSIGNYTMNYGGKERSFQVSQINMSILSNENGKNMKMNENQNQKINKNNDKWRFDNMDFIGIL